MNNLTGGFHFKASAATVLAAAVVLVSGPNAAAWSHVLTNNNSSVTIQADTDHGMSDWTVDGVTQLYKQWFWYRADGMNKELPINKLTSSITPLGLDSLGTLYSGNTFQIEIVYSLLGGAPSSGSSAIAEQIKISNLTGSPINFSFFQYVDFDLGGNHLGDTVYLEKNLQGMFEKAYQTKGNAFFADEIVSPAANHGEVGLSQSILTKLTDSAPTTLNGSTGPVVGDAVWAFQWDVVIPQNESFSIAINKSVYLTPIPEPASASLVGIGLALFLARRKRA